MWKKAYNYDKDYNQAENSDKVKKCISSYLLVGFKISCESGEGYVQGSDATHKYSDCDKLYSISFTTEVENKYLYDRWVTTIIFACFIIACDIGLAIFGFLLFKSDGSGI